MYQYRRGFTLIELLVVIAIIGLLSSVVLASLNVARTKAVDSQRESDSTQLENAITEWELDNGGTPIVGGPGAYSETYYATYSATDPTHNPISSKLIPNYMPSVPNDPQWNSGYTVDGGNAYYFIVNANSAWVSANSWSYLTQACAGHEVLVIKYMENSGNYRQDCALSVPNAISIVLQ